MDSKNKPAKWPMKKILVAAGIIITGWLAFILLFSDYSDGSSDYPSGIYEPKPSITGAPSTIPSPILNPIEAESTITELQAYILSLVGNSAYTYGDNYNGIILKEDMLHQLVNISADHAEEITVEQVNTGDMAICGNTVGICVGRYNNAPVFAYVADLSSTILPNGGVYFGYSISNKDQLLCDMYPLPFSTYYDTYTGKDSGSGTALAEKIKSLSQNNEWYSEILYECSKEIAFCNTEALLNRIPYSNLYAQNLTVLENDYSTVIKYLYISNDEEKNAENYRFMATNEFEFAEYSILQVAVLSLEESTLFEQSIKYEVTLYHDGKFLICPIIDAASYVGICGLAPKEKIVVTTDESGNEVITTEDIVYGYTVDEDGNNIFTGIGFTIYLDKTYDENGNLIEDKNNEKSENNGDKKNNEEYSE